MFIHSAGQNPPSKSENGELDWDTLVCPSNSSCMTIETGGFTRKHLEACVAWSLTQFTGAQETLLTSRQSKETLNLTSRTVGAAISRYVKQDKKKERKEKKEEKEGKERETTKNTAYGTIDGWNENV